MSEEAPKRKRGRPFGVRNQANRLGGNVPSAQLLRQVRRLTKAEVAETGSMLLLYTREEIEEMAKRPDTPMLRTMLASMILQSHKNPMAFEKLLDRIVGKVKDEIKIESTGHVENRYSGMSQEELEKKREENARLLSEMSAPILVVEALPLEQDS